MLGESESHVSQGVGKVKQEKELRRPGMSSGHLPNGTGMGALGDVWELK